MYSVIVTMSVREDQREAFERVMKELATAVKAHEPGALCYHVLRCRNEPRKYRIVEIYASKEAFQAHRNTEHVQKANPQVLATLAGTLEFEVVEVV